MKGLTLCAIVILSSVSEAFSHYFDRSIFYVEKLPGEGIVLDKGWIFYPGSNASYTRLDIDVKSGTPVNRIFIGKINVVPQDIKRVLLNLLSNSFYAVHEKKKTADEKLPASCLHPNKKVNWQD